MDTLRAIGFQPDPGSISGEGVAYDFGCFVLHALPCLSLQFHEIVLFTGVLRSPRTLGEVHFELPQRIDSQKQCAAWMVWNLDKFSEFKEIRNIDWVNKGRLNQSHLPWVKDMAEWKARPQCLVKRDWLRLALNTLEKTVETLPRDSNVTIKFDGSVLSIRCGAEAIALAGEGAPWTVSISVGPQHCDDYRSDSSASALNYQFGNRASALLIEHIRALSMGSVSRTV